MFKINPMLCIDAYKLGHVSQYPAGTTKMYSNLTPRNLRYIQDAFPEGFKPQKSVVYGLSAAFQEIVDNFNTNFFSVDVDTVMNEIKSTIAPFASPFDVDKIMDNFSALHELGYLPLKVKTLKEGTEVGPNIPVMTITNTHDGFAWLVNYLETYISSQTWKLATSATIAKGYRRIMEHYADKTGVDKSFVDFQGHDFSARGMSGIIDSSRTGSGHLTSFLGTDSVCSVPYINQYYNKGGETPLVGASVPATEHSVMCMGGMEDEVETYRRLITQYPSGIVSIVSDTWDYWNVVTNTMKTLKPEIDARTPDAMGFAKVVIRPDSGCPEDIICGIEGSMTDNTPEQKGSVECLDEIFGHDVTPTGHKTLNQKVGLIYGDSITPVRCEEILRRLADKGYSSANIVLGIGSYTYQFLTRDTLGFAVKATYGEINDKAVSIYKDPKTDPGKSSAKGLLRVDLVDGDYVLRNDVSPEEEAGGELNVILNEGKFQNLPTFEDIRNELRNNV